MLGHSTDHLWLNDCMLEGGPIRASTWQKVGRFPVPRAGHTSPLMHTAVNV